MKPKLEDIFYSKGRIKILKLLVEKREVYITEIARKTCLNYSSLRKHLEALKRLGIIEEKRYGRIRLIKLRDNEYVQKIINFIKYFD